MVIVYLLELSSGVEAIVVGKASSRRGIFVVKALQEAVAEGSARCLSNKLRFTRALIHMVVGLTIEQRVEHIGLLGGQWRRVVASISGSIVLGGRSTRRVPLAHWRGILGGVTKTLILCLKPGEIPAH
jgi:hypothetical protein